MGIFNRWRFGKVHLKVPPPPSALHGKTGCLLLRGLWDAGTRREVYLAILEAGQYASEVGSARPFRLFCTPVLAPTSYGSVGALVWEVRDRSKRVAWYEQFLNPHNPESRALLSDMEQQSHMKVVVYDSEALKVADWFEFENTFGLGRFAEAMSQCVEDETAVDFNLAQAEFMKVFDVEDLLSDGGQS